MGSRRWTVVIVVVFAVTRIAAGYVTANPGTFDKGDINPSFEISNYELVAKRINEKGERPYADFRLEYPPGEIPFLLVLEKVQPFDFKVEYIGLCILADAIGLLAIHRLARRTGSWWGVWAWLVLMPLLGPVAYSRTDIFVALALAWTVERAAAGRWGAAGAWLGFGAVMKVTPILLLPVLFLVAERRPRVVAGCATVLLAFVLPFTGALTPLYDDVIRYHSDRGVQIESVAGSLLYGWRHLTGDVTKPAFRFGGWEVVQGSVGLIKQASTALVGTILAGSAWLAARRTRRGDVGAMALLFAVTMLALVAASKVFSPQYMVWVVGAVALGSTFAPRPLRVPAALVALAVPLTFAAFPFLFFELVRQQGDAIAVTVARNVSVLAAAVVAVVVVLRQPNAKQRSSIEPSA